MDQKSLREMTIGEIQEICETTDCGKCRFYNQGPGLGCFFGESINCIYEWTDKNLNEFINMKNGTRVLPWIIIDE